MKNKTSKLSLDQFKQQLGSAEISMELISGSILGTCHDDPGDLPPNQGYDGAQIY
jgi:hypothetical protein